MSCTGKTKSGSPCKWKGPVCPHHANKSKCDCKGDCCCQDKQACLSGGNILTDNPITRRVASALKGPRNNATKRLMDALGDDKNVVIKSMKVGRKPIIKPVETALNTISLGKFAKKKKELGYEDVYHNYVIIELENGKVFKLEKNHVVEQAPLGKSDIEGELYEIPLKGKKMDTWELMKNASKDNTDPSFWRYKAGSDNCQRFTRDIVVNNGLLPDADETPIPANQDAKALIDTLPGTSTFANTVTDLANYGDRVLHGDGLKKNLNPFAPKSKRTKPAGFVGAGAIPTELGTFNLEAVDPNKKKKALQAAELFNILKTAEAQGRERAGSARSGGNIFKSAWGALKNVIDGEQEDIVGKYRAMSAAHAQARANLAAAKAAQKGGSIANIASTAIGAFNMAKDIAGIFGNKPDYAGDLQHAMAKNTAAQWLAHERANLAKMTPTIAGGKLKKSKKRTATAVLGGNVFGKALGALNKALGGADYAGDLEYENAKNTAQQFLARERANRNK